MTHDNWLALGGYTLLAVLFYAPILLGLRTFPDGDFSHHFLPFSLFQLEALRSGQLPVWNPYTYSGHPFLADPQAAVFYPLSNLLLAATLPWDSAGQRLYWLQVEAVLHVALAGFFVYLLVRDLTQTRWAAFVSGICFAFSGYLTGYPPLQLAILRTVIWLPLVLWLLNRAFNLPSTWGWWVVAALAYSCAFLAGHPQTFLHLSYVVAAFCALRLMLSLFGGGTSTHTLAGLAVFATLALGLSAAQWLPSLEFTQYSVRANVGYAFVSGGFPLQDTWQVLLPGVLTQFSPLYVGVVGLGLAVLSIGYRVSSIEREPSPLLQPRYSLLFFAVVTLAALLLAHGGNAFLYPLFYRFAPGWNLFRGQERAAFLVAFGLSILAGYGAAAVSQWSQPGALRTRQRLSLLFIGAVAMGVYGFGLFWQLFGRSAVGQGRYLVIAFVTLGLAAALVVLLRIPAWSRRRSLLVIALLVANLFWANFTTNLAPFGPARKTILAPEVVALAQAVHEQGKTNLGLPGRVYNEARVYEDYGMRSALEDVWGSSPLRLANYARLFENFPLDRLWQLTGVEHLLTWRRDLFEPGVLLAEFPQREDTTYLHRLSEPNPRAWLVPAARYATDVEAAVLLADHAFDLEQTAILSAPVAPLPPAFTAGPHKIRLERLAYNRLSVAVTSDQGGWLVVSENWLPGWHIANVRCGAANEMCVDNLAQAFRIHRVNLTFIGVVLPAGEVFFDLVYWPGSVRNGLLISGATLLIVAAFGSVQLHRRTQGKLSG
jgi:hypothetical protein